MAINSYQKNILNSVLQYPFDEIKEFDFEEKTFQNGIEDDKALKSFQLIIKEEVTPSERLELDNWDVWDGGVKSIREILQHPAPQNRPRDEDGFIQDEQDGQELEEGLLGLTTKNNDSAEDITRDDVVGFIKAEVNQRIAVMQEAGIEPAQIEERQLTAAQLQRAEELNVQPVETQEPDEIPLREIRRSRIEAEGIAERLRRPAGDGLSIAERIAASENRGESLIERAMNDSLGGEYFIDRYIQRGALDINEQNAPSNEIDIDTHQSTHEQREQNAGLLENEQQAISNNESSDRHHARRIRDEQRSSRDDNGPQRGD